jgi:hypothetical protein
MPSKRRIPGTSSQLLPGWAENGAHDGEVCGNDYDKAFELIAAGQRHIFDSFECATHRMAPVCEHGGCTVIGHGAEVNGRFFCCAHCAREAAGTDEVRERVESSP